ncbi:MAG: serine hydrolase [Bacteroidota bacterium]
MRRITYCIIILVAIIQASFAQTVLDHPSLLYIQPATIPTIDGDLSDWPSHFPSYKIAERVGGVRANSDADFSASCKVAYNKATNVLYLGIVVNDDDIVVNEAVDWQQQDAYSLYLDEQYKPSGSGVSRYTWTLGGQRALTDAQLSWDPNIQAYANWANVTHRSTHKNGQIIHELAITLHEPIYVGRAIRLGHVLVDKDENDHTSYGASRRGNKDQTSQPGRLGTLIFADDQLATGTIKGNVAWLDSTITMRPEGIRITSVDHPSFWVYHLVSRSGGNFQLELPVGAYLLQPGMKTFFSGMNYARANSSNTRQITVEQEELTEVGTFYLREVPKPDFSQLPKGLLFAPNDQLQQVDKAIQQYMDYYEIEGVSFLAFKQGKVAYKKHYGVDNAYARTKIDDQTLFEVASITKPIFAFAALKLYERGLLDLDQPLHEILPFKQIQEEPFAPLLTARIILSHRSGLPNWPRNGALAFSFRPGTNFGYSGTAYQYLGRVMEKLTGKDINTILQEEVCKPLGIEHFYFKEHEYVTQHKSHGHFNGFPGLIDQPKEPWIAGSLMTNTEELLKFLHAIKQRKGLKQETYDLMLVKQIATPEDFRENVWGHEEYMGLGFFVEETPYGKVFKHSGNNGDFKAIFKIYDGLDGGYILLTNGNTGHFIIENIERVLLDPTMF